jgi:cytochrome c oxidase cbb3-type subunit 3
VVRPTDLRAWMLLALAIAAYSVAACERESRPFRDLRQASSQAQGQPESPLAAGGPSSDRGVPSPFHNSGWGQSEGKRLFTAYNCSGCHANGGGGIGPPLMDDEWIYGFQPGNIYMSIVEGRANGMPAFRNKIPDYQVWQLVAYVQSMTGQTPIDTSPGRSDHLKPHTAEIIQPYQGRRQTGHK